MDKELLLYNYFANQLSSEEEKEFNRLLETDAEFKKQFDFEQNLKQSIRATEKQNLKAKLVAFEEAVATEPVVSTNTSSTKKLYRYFAIAASIALLIGLAWMGYRDGSSAHYEELYAANFQEYPNTVFTITRSGAEASTERKAFVAYESKKYAEAIAEFNKIPLMEQETYVDFYLAQSYVNTNENESAKKYFKKTIEKGGVFVAESHWYLALIALKEKNTKEAKYQLNELISEHAFNQEKAKALVAELD